MTELKRKMATAPGQLDGAITPFATTAIRPEHDRYLAKMLGAIQIEALARLETGALKWEKT